ncbi:MAG: enoyl-CoA hydratase [Sulfobacillus thermosulfidooxidans]|uniref:enoyl-CoA hydratase/isomerase family protein n=1 Tax=Sulfobacillus TaxID=28033 RepID=UPI000CD07BED|nr:enoyl-CoA hydratase-related protein [Sulfobacillus sp. hq2]POB11488.1 enoyl-CoA hydratase [Sulfobacillus sp. hq2]PSR37115.1 MAG: enoyl-CoA hydratase [Sulfobacillus thermosulfidooxidans]
MNILESREGGIAILQLNRPDVLNALSSALMQDLTDRLAALAHDDAVRVVILTGSPKAFAAGADIAELSHQSAADVLRSPLINRFDALRQFPKPVIAAVSGWALGGGLELVMACDMVIAGDNAHFGQPEIKIGVIPGGGGTQRLTQLVGKMRAMEMILTGDPIDADEAYRMGLVNQVVPAEDVLPAAKSLAAKIAKMPPIAVRLAKEAILSAPDLPLEAGLQHERRLFALLFSTDDQREGMQAFLEKRAPHFEGH